VQITNNNSSDLTGTYTINFGSCLLVFGGSGGSGKPGYMGSAMAAPEGCDGVIGVFKASYSAPVSYGYTIGRGGVGGDNTAQSGNTTNLGNIIAITPPTVGRGGNPGECAPGNPGSIAAGPGGTLIVNWTSVNSSIPNYTNMIQTFFGASDPSSRPAPTIGQNSDPVSTRGGGGVLKISVLG
jgi:hypothetical protein